MSHRFIRGNHRDCKMHYHHRSQCFCICVHFLAILSSNSAISSKMDLDFGYSSLLKPIQSPAS